MEKNNHSLNEILELKDLNIASYLYALKSIRLVGHRRVNGREIYFQFSPKDKAEELIKKYWNLQAQSIQPKDLFSAQRDLKDIIFSG